MSSETDNYKAWCVVTLGDAPILVEACVDSVASSLAAERGGARRLELCDALFDGGTTPSAGMIAACKAAVSIPIFVMIRPRGGGFVYSDAERDVMRRDVVVARELGADGVAIGGLRPDGTVDLELVRLLREAAHELPVTFHRAFDFTPDLAASLELLANSGVQRVLSSGGAATAADGATVLADLVRQAGSRLVVIAGGGVREGKCAQSGDGLPCARGSRSTHSTDPRRRTASSSSRARAQALARRRGSVGRDGRATCAKLRQKRGRDIGPSDGMTAS